MVGVFGMVGMVGILKSFKMNPLGSEGIGSIGWNFLESVGSI